MAEAAERFKASQLLEAMVLAQKAKTLYPFLPHLDSFIVALRVVLIAGCMPRNDSLWHAVLGSNSTDCFEVVKNKHRELCDLTNPDRNLNAAAEAAFRLVNQAWDALRDRVRVTTVNANYIRHPPERPQQQTKGQKQYYYCNRVKPRRGKKRARAEAKERFEANQIVEAIVLAQRAYKLYPLLPGPDNFIVDLRILAVRQRMTIVPSDNSAWHAILESKKTDSFEVVKNKYRVLCKRTISVGNLNVAAETAFRIVNQAWDAPMNQVSSNSCPQR
ncbi:uncharacterized protein A4U43_C06F2600 [Asparagus officinalis]|uniref:J domain-containing protein n=1 Tax=Asparagus officinalis TaxID=4686 RepID=A0A5P1EJ04_ASPOF|nr:uncharacterized protein A4U43_C06F2600 [Asparagus officinalis]